MRASLIIGLLQTAATEPSGYWKDAFAPSTLSNWLLAIGAGAAIFVGLKTLRAIKRQTEIQRVAMDQWVDTDFEKAGPEHILPTAAEADLRISFRIGNPTKFKLNLSSVMVWVDRRHMITINFFNVLLTPETGDAPVSFKRHLDAARVAAYRAGHLSFELGARVRFIDAFKETQEQLIGYTCTCGPANEGTFTYIAFQPPTEEEEKAQQKQKSQS